MNESNQVYSFPSCENPNVSIILTEKLIKDNFETNGYLYPEAMEFQLEGFFILSLNGYVYPVYEIKDSKLEVHAAGPTGILYYRDFPPGLPFYSSRFTAEKADSLAKMILPYSFPNPSYVEFILDGNQLILYNPKFNIRALFTSD